jgi:DNA-binding NarL/FixJ family response regulator
MTFPILDNGLTSRQMEVASLVAKGWANKEIAPALGISMNTVGAHVQDILLRLKLNNRTKLAVWYLEREHVHS